MFPEETDMPLGTFEEVEAEVVKIAINSLFGIGKKTLTQVEKPVFKGIFGSDFLHQQAKN